MGKFGLRGGHGLHEAGANFNWLIPVSSAERSVWGMDCDKKDPESRWTNVATRLTNLERWYPSVQGSEGR